MFSKTMILLFVLVLSGSFLEVKSSGDNKPPPDLQAALRNSLPLATIDEHLRMVLTDIDNNNIIVHRELEELMSTHFSKLDDKDLREIRNAANQYNNLVRSRALPLTRERRIDLEFNILDTVLVMHLVNTRIFQRLQGTKRYPNHLISHRLNLRQRLQEANQRFARVLARRAAERYRNQVAAQEQAQQAAQDEAQQAAQDEAQQAANQQQAEQDLQVAAEQVRNLQIQDVQQVQQLVQEDRNLQVVQQQIIQQNIQQHNIAQQQQHIQPTHRVQQQAFQSPRNPGRSCSGNRPC